MSDSDSKPRVSRGNNTTISSASLHAENPNDSHGTPPPPRGPRKRHEHIRTSEEELKQFNRTYHAKETTQYMDPCRAQTKASLKCMDENNYDKRKCTRFFKDYSDCKKQWMASLREERRKRNLGIVDDDDESNQQAAVKQDAKSTPTPTSTAPTSGSS